MSKIIFKTLEYSNFRSVGSTPIKLNLNEFKTTLISGTNGSGKTTVMSALCFALFGRGYGSINKSALINSINQKKLHVTVEFTIGKKNFKINRGIKPNIFEIYEDGKLINQDPKIKDYQKVLEQQILKFNYRGFTQVVLVGGGSEYTSFMRLGAKDRREFIEDLLDIRVFSTMNNIIKEDVKVAKDNLKELNTIIKAIKDKILLQESFIKKMKRDKNNSAEKVNDTIKSLLEENEQLIKDVTELEAALVKYKVKVDEHSELDDKITELRMSMKQTESRLEKKKEKKSFYDELNVCPTCSQTVSDEHKKVIASGVTSEVSQIATELQEIKENELELHAIMESYNDAINEYGKIQKNINELNTKMYANNMAVNNANAQLNEIQEDTSSIEHEITKLKSFAKEFVDSDKQKKKLLSLQAYQELIQQVLSDSGIKSKIIRQYIPTINKLINYYMTELDFFCNFNLDEHFNETIKSRHRDSFTYDNFSEGQKRRIDLAILLTWVEIAKAKNALHTNVMFLDEMDSMLDKDGAELFLAALKSSHCENIFFISHKYDILSDKVDNVIQFRLHNNFTELVV